MVDADLIIGGFMVVEFFNVKCLRIVNFSLDLGNFSN